METDGDGNLCWQAAFEQEIASLAVGIRSFPKEGLNAEKYLRDAYIAQLTRLGGQVRLGLVCRVVIPCPRFCGCRLILVAASSPPSLAQTPDLPTASTPLCVVFFWCLESCT